MAAAWAFGQEAAVALGVGEPGCGVVPSGGEPEGGGVRGLAQRLFQGHGNLGSDARRKSRAGILISDDYGAYLSWEHGRQTCLAHLLRAARGLSESGDERTADGGRWGFGELSRLVRMSPESTTASALRAFLARFRRHVARYRDVAGKAVAFVRRLDREFGELVTFLLIPGVEPTNNLAERSVRHGGVRLRRKISIGTFSEWGRRWVERSLSLYQTCLSQKKGFFEVMREALSAFFHNQPPDLGWIEDIAAQYAPAAAPNPATP